MVLSGVPAWTQQSTETNSIPGQLLVQLQPGTGYQSFSRHLLSENIFITGEKNISPSLNIWILYFDEAFISGNDMLKKLEQFREIQHVQYNHYLSRRNTLPDDASFLLQWNMLNVGAGGVDDADIDADEAWDITTGGITLTGDTIVIAIIDDGFDLAHDDLDFWKNYDEIEGNALDDDNNGFTDDKKGWNATNHKDSLPIFNHGTHVSGIAGAIGNNNIGVAGVNWTVKIMPVSTDVIESEVVEAYNYVLAERKIYNATDGAKGSFIVATNSSFGVDFADPSEFPIWCSMYDSLGKAGILNAAATINANFNVDVVGDMPTTCSSDYLIAVTNTNKSDNLSGAGYGAVHIDLGAPGAMVYSTYSGNSYNYLTGTSMSSPHVAGAIALLMSAACEKFLIDYKADPAATILFLKQYIIEGADSIASLNGISVSGGRLNLYNSIHLLLEEYCSDAIIDIPVNMMHATLFPNPASSYISVRMQDINDLQKMMRAEITNLLGENMLMTDLLSGSELSQSGINITSYPKGMYIISIFDTDNILMYSSNFIIQ
ncbi:MAG: S8 family peptidase [Chitinophagales bacterium]|nr:S8 family peptidase [Chitinophagales bacterium]